jgi:hypothetical protein
VILGLIAASSILIASAQDATEIDPTLDSTSNTDVDESKAEFSGDANLQQETYVSRTFDEILFLETCRSFFPSVLDPGIKFSTTNLMHFNEFSGLESRSSGPERRVFVKNFIFRSVFDQMISPQFSPTLQQFTHRSI